MKRCTHTDGYSEAIPIDDLMDIASADDAMCGAQSDEVIRRCAEYIVREKMCPCASSVSAIVDVIVEEFQKQLQRK